MGRFIHTYPFFAIMITVITMYMVAIGIGWLWAYTAQWRGSRQLPFPQPYWFIRWKWTAIQIYQKFIQWCHKK